MKFNYRKARSLGIAALIIFVVLGGVAIVLANMVYINPMYFFAAGVLTAFDIIFLITALVICYLGWKCPKCGTFLGFWFFGKKDRCDHCSKYLDWKK